MKLGVICFKNRDYPKALQYFHKVLELTKIDDSNVNVSDIWEASLFNLGHCYRKLKQYSQAFEYYQRSLSVCPNNPSTYSALGYCHHLLDNVNVAIEYYHQGLSIKEDTLTTELLNMAFKQTTNSFPLKHLLQEQ